MMRYDPNKHHRRSIRLRDYDYSQPGYYFVTMCVKDRHQLFGEVENNHLILNPIGLMIQSVWKELPQYIPYMEQDEYIVMPNHLHGIVNILDPDKYPNSYGFPAGATKCPDECDDANDNAQRDIGGRSRRIAPTVGYIISRFKSYTTKCYYTMGNPNAMGTIITTIWQRNYYEHVIRTDADLDRIRGYIQYNPIQWETDEYYQKEERV